MYVVETLDVRGPGGVHLTFFTERVCVCVCVCAGGEPLCVCVCMADRREGKGKEREGGGREGKEGVTCVFHPEQR